MAPHPALSTKTAEWSPTKGGLPLAALAGGLLLYHGLKGSQQRDQADAVRQDYAQRAGHASNNAGVVASLRGGAPLDSVGSVIYNNERAASGEIGDTFMFDKGAAAHIVEAGRLLAKSAAQLSPTEAMQLLHRQELGGGSDTTQRQNAFIMSRDALGEIEALPENRPRPSLLRTAGGALLGAGLGAGMSGHPVGAAVGALAGGTLGFTSKKRPDTYRFSAEQYPELAYAGPGGVTYSRDFLHKLPVEWQQTAVPQAEPAQKQAGIGGALLGGVKNLAAAGAAKLPKVGLGTKVLAGGAVLGAGYGALKAGKGLYNYGMKPTETRSLGGHNAGLPQYTNQFGVPEMG